MKQYPVLPDAAKPPEIKMPLDTNALKALLTYFREQAGADAVNGYQKCREVNFAAVKYLKNIFPQLKIYYLFCPNYYGIRRSPQIPSEHFVGAVEGETGWFWFDGTGDQLNTPGSNEILLIHHVDTLENLQADLVEAEGGVGWELHHV